MIFFLMERKFVKIYSVSEVKFCIISRLAILDNLPLIIFQVVLAAQLVCWTAQFIGHGVFEVNTPIIKYHLV